jgi:pimeloyl-ACP methyl ester carboxylesterase
MKTTAALRAKAITLSIALTLSSALAVTASAQETHNLPVQTLPGFASATGVVNGIGLHYVIGGKGEPLVLLPGAGETWLRYREIMPALARNYLVIAVDVRGTGGSGRPDFGNDAETMSADILGLVHQLGYTSAHIAGHGTGAIVALRYATSFPEATRTLAIIDGPPAPPLPLPVLAARMEPPTRLSATLQEFLDGHRAR